MATQSPSFVPLGEQQEDAEAEESQPTQEKVLYHYLARGYRILIRAHCLCKYSTSIDIINFIISMVPARSPQIHPEP